MIKNIKNEVNKKAPQKKRYEKHKTHTIFDHFLVDEQKEKYYKSGVGKEEIKRNLVP